MSDFAGSIAVGGLILCLGGWVYYENLRSPINRILFLLAISTSISIFSGGLENESLVPYVSYLFLRIEFSAASMAAYFFLLFCLSFHEVHLLSSSFRKILVFLPAAAFTLLPFLDLIITGTRFYDYAIPFRMGPLFSFYMAYLMVFTGAGCLDLILKYRKFRGIKAMQTLYLLFGFLLTAAIAVPLNLFSRSQFLPRVSGAGNYGFLFFIGFTPMLSSNIVLWTFG